VAWDWIIWVSAYPTPAPMTSPTIPKNQQPSLWPGSTIRILEATSMHLQPLD